METKNNLIYADECYQIMGIVFKVYNELGFGHKENYYQKALAEEFKNNKISFKEQLRCKLKYKDKDVGLYILDFLVFDRIILEIKQKNFISGKDIKQLYSYLKVMNLKLGLIITFTKDQVKYKRIVNL
ncbi:MAG: GxxExxY protein [Candidatus Moraniibacteriota bacterium]